MTEEVAEEGEGGVRVDLQRHKAIFQHENLLFIPPTLRALVVVLLAVALLVEAVIAMVVDEVATVVEIAEKMKIIEEGVAVKEAVVAEKDEVEVVHHVRQKEAVRKDQFLLTLPQILSPLLRFHRLLQRIYPQSPLDDRLISRASFSSKC